jgi:predicted nucleotidyltransferase
MRLYQFEKDALKKVFQNFEGEIYMFGSRLDNNKKGGDIDLIIKPKKKLTLKDIISMQAKYFFLQT